MLKKSTALEWLALCSIPCVMATGATWFIDFYRHIMVITGKMIFIITLIFVQKYRKISTLLWRWSKKRGHMLA